MLPNRWGRFKLAKTSRDVDRAVAALVDDAAKRVPAYRGLSHGADAASAFGAADLVRLPILERETAVRWSATDLFGFPHPPRFATSAYTSGSSGLPLRVYQNPIEAGYRKLLLFRALRRAYPFRLPFRFADVGSVVRGPATSIERTPYFTLLRVPGNQPLTEQLGALKRFRPELVEGYPTTLSLVAAELLRRGTTLRPSPHLVATRGELLDAATRRLLESAFGCAVSDNYNCEEVGNVAWECPHRPGTYHVNTDGCWVEVLDDAGRPCPPEVEGRVVVTNLFNRTMPFIRYALRDRVAWVAPKDDCGCGHWAPRLGGLSGRKDDFLRLPDGRRISPRVAVTALDNAFERAASGEDVLAYRQLQIVQDGPDHVSVYVVPEERSSVDVQRTVREGFRDVGFPWTCDVTLVRTIPLEPSGKIKKVVCRASSGASPN